MNEILRFASECGPDVGLLLDSWHWYHAGASVDDILKAGKSRIVTVHVSDSGKTEPQDVRDNPWVLAGEGVIDLVGYFKALQEIDFCKRRRNPQAGVKGPPPKDMSPEEGAGLGLESTLAVMRKANLVEEAKLRCTSSGSRD